MLLSAVSVLVVAQSSSEIPEGLMNNSVYQCPTIQSCWITGFYYLIAYCMNKVIASQITHIITSKVEIRFYYWSLKLQLRLEESLVKCYMIHVVH